MCGKSGDVITVKDIRGLDGLSQWHWANFNSDPGNSGAEEDFFFSCIKISCCWGFIEKRHQNYRTVRRDLHPGRHERRDTRVTHPR